jgi:hypothetical protein
MKQNIGNRVEIFGVLDYYLKGGPISGKIDTNFP